MVNLLVFKDKDVMGLLLYWRMIRWH